MDSYQEVMVALSESVMRPLAEKITMTSYPACKKTVITETMHPIYNVTMERYQEVMVALSDM